MFASGTLKDEIAEPPKMKSTMIPVFTLVINSRIETEC